MNKQALLDSWKMFRCEHDVSVDRMICDPLLRKAFLASLGPAADERSEKDILWTLMSLPKGKGKELSK